MKQGTMTDDLFDPTKHKIKKDRHNLMAYESDGLTGRKHWIVGYDSGPGMVQMKLRVFLSAQDAEDFVLAVQAHGMGAAYHICSCATCREARAVDNLKARL